MHYLSKRAIVIRGWTLAGAAACGVAMAPVVAFGQDRDSAKPFWFIFLERGKQTPDDKQAVAEMQRGHIDNFKRLFAEKKLFAAGPLRDPAGQKRGIVVVRASSRAELLGYFQQDDYVREGYMTVSATTSIVHKALNAEGVDPDGIEEVRIVQITRPAVAPDLDREERLLAHLRTLVGQGSVGAWYALGSGPIAHVLFARTTNSKALEDLLAQHPAVAATGSTVLVWPQWLGKGVLN